MTHSLKVNDCISGIITAIAFGGAGILKHAGFVIFTPYTAVGDEVYVRITKAGKNFAHAELVNIISPGPQRTSPLCPYFGTCGGCQLQHLEYAAQLNYKKQAVEESLKRIGKIEDFQAENASSSTHPWAYRRHIRLKLRSEGTRFSAGYIANDQKTLLQVTSCPIFIQESTVLVEFQNLMAQLSSPITQEGNATLLKEEQGDGFLCVLRFEKAFPVNFEEVVQAAIKHWPLWKGVQGIAGKKILSFGATSTKISIDSLQIHCSPNAFIQNHPEQSKAIYSEVCARSLQANAKKVLDLYCGIGITSLLLGRTGIQVLGIEENPEAIALAKKNAADNQIKNVQFIQGDAGKALSSLPFLKEADLVILNPPRIGLDSMVIDSIGRMHPRTLLYISCMPSTLARDLAKFREYGYAISFCKPYDMFPQTAHVETVVELRL